MDEDLQLPGLVDGGIEQGEKTLWTGTRSVPISKGKLDGKSWTSLT